MATTLAPMCTRCQRRHFNYLKCEKVAKSIVQPIFRKRANDWGDRLTTTVAIAPGVVGHRRKPLGEERQ